jgi:hypothetical protein
LRAPQGCLSQRAFARVIRLTAPVHQGTTGSHPRGYRLFTCQRAQTNPTGNSTSPTESNHPTFRGGGILTTTPPLSIGHRKKSPVPSRHSPGHANHRCGLILRQTPQAGSPRIPFSKRVSFEHATQALFAPVQAPEQAQRRRYVTHRRLSGFPGRSSSPFFHRLNKRPSTNALQQYAANPPGFEISSPTAGRLSPQRSALNYTPRPAGGSPSGPKIRAPVRAARAPAVDCRRG